MSTLEKAISLAALAHEGQQDKAGAPYILHPLRVMLAMSGDDDRIVAVLHDVLEDTSWTPDGLRREGFSPTIVEAIECLTRRPNETYDAFILRVRANPVGRRVKLADLADNSNLSRLQDPSQEDHERVLKYKKAMATLLDPTGG